MGINNTETQNSLNDSLQLLSMGIVPDSISATPKLLPSFKDFDNDDKRLDAAYRRQVRLLRDADECVSQPRPPVALCGAVRYASYCGQYIMGSTRLVSFSRQPGCAALRIVTLLQVMLLSWGRK